MNLSTLRSLNMCGSWYSRRHQKIECEPKAEIESDLRSMILDYIAGCIGGVAGVIVGHPLDTVKVHMQTQDPMKPLYKGTFHCLYILWLNGGVKGLFSGVTSPIMGIGIINAIVFGVYGNVLRFYDNSNSLKVQTLAGCAGGAVQSIVCAPMELAKTRVQLQRNDPTAVQHKGPLQCIIHTFKTEGLVGTMRGLDLTIARDIPGFAAYFASYEYLMQLSPKPGIIHNLVAGGIAGMCSWIVAYPIDVVKTCMQADIAGPNRKYKGTWDCIKKEYKNGGMPFFFRGLNSTLIRSFPMNAVTFYVVALVLRFTHASRTSSVSNSFDRTLPYTLDQCHEKSDNQLSIDETLHNSTSSWDD